MGLKTELISEVTSEVVSKATVVTGTGVAAMGANNKFQFIPDLTLDEWAILIGILVTVGGGVISILLKLEARRRRNRIYTLVEERYKRTGEFPKEIFDEDNKESSGLL